MKQYAAKLATVDVPVGIDLSKMTVAQCTALVRLIHQSGEQRNLARLMRQSKEEVAGLLNCFDFTGDEEDSDSPAAASLVNVNSPNQALGGQQVSASPGGGPQGVKRKRSSEPVAPKITIKNAKLLLDVLGIQYLAKSLFDGIVAALSEGIKTLKEKFESMGPEKAKNNPALCAGALVTAEGMCLDWSQEKQDQLLTLLTTLVDTERRCTADAAQVEEDSARARRESEQAEHDAVDAAASEQADNRARAYQRPPVVEEDGDGDGDDSENEAASDDGQPAPASEGEASDVELSDAEGEATDEEDTDAFVDLVDLSA
jgi:hypothetical protein